jgi:hypothetical protein
LGLFNNINLLEKYAIIGVESELKLIKKSKMYTLELEPHPRNNKTLLKTLIPMKIPTIE